MLVNSVLSVWPMVVAAPMITTEINPPTSSAAQYIVAQYIAGSVHKRICISRSVVFSTKVAQYIAAQYIAAQSSS
jgi:hypothetical protein